MGVERRLLRLAEVGADERHAAMGQTHLGLLHRHRQPIQFDALVAAVELVGFARLKPQRDEGLRRRSNMFGAPVLHESMDAVCIDPLFEAPEPARVRGASVTFEPGARTAWHTHPLGQTLIVTSGLGWVQREGGPIQEIRPGDVVWL